MKKIFSIFALLIGSLSFGSAKGGDCLNNQSLKALNVALPFGVFYFMENQQEVWKDIPEYEGYYQVSNMGRIKSLKREVVMNNHGTLVNVINPERILKGGLDKNGYSIYTLCANKKRKTIKGHRVVAIAFIENPLNLPDVNHKYGIKSDNRVTQLEWMTKSDNVQHSFDVLGRIGLHGIKSSTSKKIYQYTPTGVLVNTFESLGDVRRKLGHKQSIISDCANHRWNSAYGYIWSHKELTIEYCKNLKIAPKRNYEY